MTTTPRLDTVSGADERALLEQLLALAPRGLALAHDASTGRFAQTVRAVTEPAGVRVRPEGTNLRYAAMAALGLDRLTAVEAKQVLGGQSVDDVLAVAEQDALTSEDPGAVALVVWTLAETRGRVADALVDRLVARLRSEEPIPTVDGSWVLTAAVAADAVSGRTDPRLEELLERASTALLREQGERGLYPHWLPASSQSRWRSHVGSFADQVYPLQALARAGAATDREEWVRAAEITAQRLCDLQGDAGQWWWHYDSRDGEVVESFPVYSVHQHAMAPMVLHDLREAGGRDLTAHVDRGVSWLHRHPEVVEELVSERWGLVWRKVGRQEPPKAARAVGAVTTSVRPGLHVPGLNTLLPPTRVDHECRPYELGWMLYAWLPRRNHDES